ATGEPEDKDGKAKHREDHQPHPEMPLLIALNAPRSAPASGAADANGKAGITAGTPQAPNSEPTPQAANRLETTAASVAASVPAALPRDKAGTPATDPRSGKPPIQQNATLPAPAASAGVELDGEAPQEPSATFDMQAGRDSTKAALRNSRADAQSAPPVHVVVTGEHSFPAPAQHPASQTATSLASVIAMDGGARAAFSPSNGFPQWASAVAPSSHMLKIELHPAELGMVTANLRLSGGQLSIELTPENHEA